MTIPLQSSPVYGPVRSRRLGRSLGLNILSVEQKTCSFNCLHCQYGLEQLSDEELTDPYWYIPVEQVADALERALFTLEVPAEYITFSGNGESTLHPEFKEMVETVRNIRDRYAPGSQLALLSNASTIHLPVIRAALSYLDHRIMKFDCANEALFMTYNQPNSYSDYQQIFNGLIDLPDVTIQALFAAGKSGNYIPDLMDQWIEKIVAIAPREVQIYTLDRSYASKDIAPVTRQILESIQKLGTEAGLKIKVY